jgi:hypothetical protein
LALVLGLFDLFDKYGISTFNFKGKKWRNIYWLVC